MDCLQGVLCRTRKVFALAVATALLPALGSTHAAASIDRPWDSYVPDEVLVKFKDSTTVEELARSLSAQLGAELEQLDAAGLTRVKLKDGQRVEEALAEFQGDRDVEYVQPNYIYALQAVPNDPMFNVQWGLRNVGQTIVRDNAQPDAPIATHNPGTAGMDMSLVPAWDVITDCSPVIVGVVDSGINYAHEDLGANLWSDPEFPDHGYNFVDMNRDPIDLNGHGTHVSGTIGAVGNNGRGGTGICWRAKIMALRVCNTAGQCTTARTIAAVNFAVAHGAKVINLSLGGGNFDQALSDAIRSAGNHDVVVVTAAGNQGNNNDSTTTPTYPCNFGHPNLICVAALDQAYALANFSNYGATKVHVGAPGVNVVSTWAGAQTRIADNFTSWTATPQGWANGARPIGDRVYSVLLNPAGYPSGTYRANADDRAYKSFNLGSARIAVLSLAGQVDLAQGDYLNIYTRPAIGDPISSGARIFRGTGSTGGRVLAFPDLDISSCISASCTVGFQLQSGTGPPARGVLLVGFTIKTLQLNSTTYDVLAGTSMAAPHVAGLAAMLRAYNPAFTAADVLAAITNGGTAVAALAGKTVTGKVVNAMGSLAYIKAPSGITAAVKP